MTVSTRKVISRIQTDFREVSEYNDLVDSWSQLCDRAWNQADSDFQFADIEKAAFLALSGTDEDQDAGQVGNDISRMLNSFSYPSYLVKSNGFVAALNFSAWTEFSVDVGERIDNLPFLFDASQSLSQIIEKIFDKKPSEVDTGLILKRSYSRDGQQESTIAISASPGKVPAALVFVITAQWKPGSVDVLKHQFGLTKTEAELLVSFVDGYSTQDIATFRCRSHETIRAQFQSIRLKLGVRNQTDLLRTTLAISGFESEMAKITDTVKHPHRRKAVIFRKGGRRIELTMMGDFKGDPVLTIANIMNYTFNSQIEQKLFEAGICLVSICAPGCGDTDPAPHNQTKIDCLCLDVEAVLKQIDAQSCLMFAYNGNCNVSYKLANRIRCFYHLMQVAAPPPLVPSFSNLSRSSYNNGIARAAQNHPALKKIMIKGALKAMRKLGMKNFFKLQFKSDSYDAQCILKDENLEEYNRSLAIATRGGVASAAEDVANIYDDWLSDAENLPVKVTAIHGVQDSLFTIDNTRIYASNFPDKIKMYEVEGAGFPIMQSHPDVIIGHFKTAIETYRPCDITHSKAQ